VVPVGQIVRGSAARWMPPLPLTPGHPPIIDRWPLILQILTAASVMMEAASTSETSVNFSQTPRRNNPEYSHLQDGDVVFLDFDAVWTRR
jgi:hypothetical protein